jgi:hypothetical protein
MNDFLATFYAELGYELSYELHCFAIRMPENTTLICIGIQKLFY